MTRNVNDASLHNERRFDRVNVDFALAVEGVDPMGNPYKDYAVCKNIAGEGINFITHQADKYFLGQDLDIAICLPGTGDVQATMNGKANVVRIESVANADPNKDNKAMSIAVKLYDSLRFKRNDHSTA